MIQDIKANPNEIKQYVVLKKTQIFHEIWTLPYKLQKISKDI
jgi:hypothetical protein